MHWDFFLTNTVVYSDSLCVISLSICSRIRKLFVQNVCSILSFPSIEHACCIAFQTFAIFLVWSANCLQFYSLFVDQSCQFFNSYNFP